MLIVILRGTIKSCAQGHVSMASNLLPLIAYTITFECSNKHRYAQRGEERGTNEVTKS